MKAKTTYILLISLLLIVASLSFLFLGSGRKWFRDFTGNGQIKQAQNLYTCPMHPQVIQDSPGKCPICFMDLVPMQGHTEHEHASTDGYSKENGTDRKNSISSASDISEIKIKVEPAVVQKMGVRTAVVKREVITREIRSVAHIDFAEDAEAVVNARYNGWVEKLYVRITGQTVRRGQALAGIYSPELVATQAEYLQLFASMQNGDPDGEFQSLLSAARQRLEFWNISRSQIRALEKRGRPSRLLTIHAPIAGVITEKQVVQGAKIKEGMDLFRIINLSRVWAYMHIPEKDIQFIQLNMPVEMDVPQLIGQKFKGKVNFIFPYLERQARYLRVRVSFANPGYKLKPGMYATLKTKRTLPGESLTVPSSAIIRTGERELVFVHYGNGLFEPRKIVSGVPANGDRIQVLQGLNDEEAVVVSGQFLLDSETRIQEAVRKMRRQSFGDAINKNEDGSRLLKNSVELNGGHQH